MRIEYPKAMLVPMRMVEADKAVLVAVLPAYAILPRPKAHGQKRPTEDQLNAGAVRFQHHTTPRLGWFCGYVSLAGLPLGSAFTPVRTMSAG